MISVAEADRILARFQGLFPVESVPLEHAAGRVLREDLRADRAYPAQDRSRMDGIAVAAAAWDMGIRAFPVTGLARAGEPRGRLDDASACVEIMTGAAVPEGADAVIPYERLVLENGVATLVDEEPVVPGAFVHRGGSDCAAGAALVPAGVRLNGAHLAIAASVGTTRLAVARRPRVAVVSTGDELVGVAETPRDHQLRMSNAHGLAGLLAPWAAVTIDRCGDEPAALESLLREKLSACDLLLVSGGVSAGKFDAVPETLERLGVEKVFHKIAQKPGKPLWFGSFRSSGLCSSPLPLGEGSGVRAFAFNATATSLEPATLMPESPSTAADRGEPPLLPVFGLPGNPVSALVCARRYVLPLLWRLSGRTDPPRRAPALASPAEASARLTRFLPVRLAAGPGGDEAADPRAVNGSGDFAALGGTDGFVEVPAAENHFPAGARMAFFGWSS